MDRIFALSFFPSGGTWIVIIVGNSRITRSKRAASTFRTSCSRASVKVLTLREVANQQQAMYLAEKDAQDKRLDLEASRGKADMQSELAKSTVCIDIAKNKASAVKAEADGESYRREKVGRAGAVKTEAEGLAIAKGLEAQQLAIGKEPILPMRWRAARSASCRKISH
jgi:hypothetical protein